MVEAQRDQPARGTMKENPIVPAGGQSIVDVLSDVLLDKSLSGITELWIELNAKLLMISRTESEVSIHVESSEGGQPISQEEANGFLNRALELNKILDQLEADNANVIANYEEYQKARGMAYYNANHG